WRFLAKNSLTEMSRCPAAIDSAVARRRGEPAEWCAAAPFLGVSSAEGACAEGVTLAACAPLAEPLAVEESGVSVLERRFRNFSRNFRGAKHSSSMKERTARRRQRAPSGRTATAGV